MGFVILINTNYNYTKGYINNEKIITGSDGSDHHQETKSKEYDTAAAC